MKHTRIATAALTVALAAAGCQKSSEPAVQDAPRATPAPTVASRAPGSGWEAQPAQPAVPVSAPEAQGAVAVPAAPPAAAESAMEVAIYRRTPSGQPERVGTDFVFRSGDGVRFGIKASRDGFLYLVMKGSSGRSTVIYPDKRIARGQHSIKAGEEVLVPDKLWFQFDRKPGTETVYAMFTPTPDALTAGLDALGAGTAAPPAPALEAQVLAQLQSKSRSLPISGQLQSGPAAAVPAQPSVPGIATAPVAPAAAAPVAPAAAAPATAAAPAAQQPAGAAPATGPAPVAATTGSLVAVITLRHE